MVSRTFCNYESTKFSRNWVCLFILMYCWCIKIDVNNNIHFRRKYKVTELMNLSDEFDNNWVIVYFLYGPQKISNIWFTNSIICVLSCWISSFQQLNCGHIITGGLGGYGLAIANIIIKRGGRVLLTDINTEVNLEDYIGTHRSVANILIINIVSNSWYLFED